MFSSELWIAGGAYKTGKKVSNPKGDSDEATTCIPFVNKSMG